MIKQPISVNLQPVFFNMFKPTQLLVRDLAADFTEPLTFAFWA